MKGKLKNFSDSISRFLEVLESLSGEGFKRDNVLEVLVDLRLQAIKMRNEIIIFVHEIESDFDKMNGEFDSENMNGADVLDAGDVFLKMRKKLELSSERNFLEDEEYQQVIFNISEIYEELHTAKMIIDKMMFDNKFDSADFYQKLESVAANMRDHVLSNHFDDLVGFDGREVIFSAGLIDGISKILESYEYR